MFMISPRGFRSGGMEVIYHGLAASLRERGHTVDDAFLGSTFVHEQGAQGDTWELPLHTPRTRWRLPTPLSVLQSVASLVRTARTLRRARPDVVYVHFIETHAVYFVLLRRLFGYRLVLSARGSDLLRTANALDRAVLPHLLRRADALVVASDAVHQRARQLCASLEGRIVKIPNGVDLSFWRRTSPAGDKGVLRVVSVGRLESVKGPDVLVRAFIELAPLVPNAHLTLVGEGSLRPELQEAVTEAGLAERIVFTGPLGHEDIRSRLHGADILAMPSRSEGFGLSALEGMAAGLPVVGSAVGGLPELVGEGGVLVPPEETAALRDALLRVLQDDAYRRNLADAALQRACLYDWPRAVDAYEAILAGL
jgi:glycosyltransferase involved in cell wall biosynthesis